MIKNIQFVGRPPLVNGVVATGYISEASPGVVELKENPSGEIEVRMHNGDVMCFPLGSVYVTRYEAPVVKEEKPAAPVVKKKRGRPRKAKLTETNA